MILFYSCAALSPKTEQHPLAVPGKMSLHASALDIIYELLYNNSLRFDYWREPVDCKHIRIYARTVRKRS